ncbi:MAG: peptidoglycan DD-metalloendopeptidase family protein [Hyphomicrobiaceae bacterium]
MLSPQVALAQSKSGLSRGEAREALEKTQQQLRENREKEQGIASDVGQMTADRERLNQSLVEMARSIQASEGRLTVIEGHLETLEAREKKLRASLSHQHGSLVHLLAALQRMGRNPPPVLITGRKDALTMVRSALILASAFPQLRSKALKLAGELKELERIITETRVEGEKLKTETQRLGRKRLELSALLEEKKQSIAEKEAALARVRRETSEMARSVTSLNELISKLDKTFVANIAPATPPPALRPTSPPAAPALQPGNNDVVALNVPLPPKPERPRPATPLAPQEVVLAPQHDAIRRVDAGRIEPARPFQKTKGHLPLPAQGKIILRYGDKAQSSHSNGIVIQTRAGAQVTSPSDGWIVFAGVFRSYGQILIINAGGGYHILLANLSQIDVQLGQFVLSGEPVGKMANSGSTVKGQKATPVLYVEFRKENRPIDPTPWWVASNTQ